MRTDPTTTTVSTTTQPVTFTLVNPGPLLTSCPAACPTGWQYYSSSCYQKFTTTATFAEAVTACASQGAQLVEIDSFDENDALRKAFDTNALVTEAQESWIGLSLTSGSWKWVDGSTAGYTNWAPTQPYSDQCVQMITDALNNATYQYQRGGWKTYDCTKTSASYICEKSAS
ncbi:hypothetical protein L5515_005924 [Caenorhabditis briggsae]|uniref:C-type lectin domain-containing protein n=1 Tax=Caenorhabditis briggsae TaxID=6238 RepID=A0AAE9JHJ0_CAEBR|nr:hypothetical protein L5515_005924 [Caenorhabditis briggsae]